MNEHLPEGPFFIPPLSSSQGGVDFLGLRQVNLDYMSNCIPGINNVTKYIRPFSVISWMYWKIHNILNEKNISDIDKVTYDKFCEKVETLFTWGHINNGTRGIPGFESQPPAAKSGKVSLLFNDWNRKKQNTSIMAAVQYGPASKTINGLSFIKPLEDGYFKTCNEGINLAQALDVTLKKEHAYSIINDLNKNEATEENAKELYKSWNIHGVSKAEKEAFLKAFIDKSQINDDTSIGHRTATIELLKFVLKNNKNKMNIHDLRVNMAYGFNSKGKFIDFNQSLKNAQYRWLVLQIRQAQRLALESLFSWIEYMILENHLTDMDSISNKAFKILNTSPFFKNRKDIISIYNSMFNKYNSINSMIDDIENNDGLCIFEMMNDIQERLNDFSDEIIVSSMQTIFLCSYYFDLLKKEKNVCDLFSQGDSARISLRYLNETLKKCGDMKL